MSRLRRDHVVLAVILIVAAALRFRGLSFGLPYPDGRPDEMSMVMYSLGLLFAGMNPHFFHWPSLMFYTLAAGYRVAWEVGHWRGLFALKFDMFRAASTHAAPYLLGARVFVAIAGVVTVWLVYRFVARVFDRLTAVVAAGFLAVAFVHVRDSHFGVTDVPATALVVAALIPFAAAADDPGRRRPWVLAGILSGLAASTKYNAGLVAVLSGVLGAIAVLRATPASRRPVAMNVLWCMIATGAAFLAGTPYAVLDASTFFRDLQFDSQHLLEGHGIDLGPGWTRHLLFSLRYGLGTPLLLTGLAGLVVVALASWRKAVLVCVVPVLYYALIGRGSTVFVRYIMPVVPFLCIAAAVLVVTIVRRIVPAAFVPLAAGVAATAIASPSIARDWHFDRLSTFTDTRVIAAQWLDARREGGDAVYQSPPDIVYAGLGMDKPAALLRFDPPSRTFARIASDEGGREVSGGPMNPEWILVAESPLSVYTTVPAGLPEIVTRDYVLQETIRATRGAEPPEWFDEQDRFFLPFVDFSLRERPGPEIRIYKHR